MTAFLRRFVNFLTQLLAIGIILAAGYVIYLLIRSFVAALPSIDPGVIAALIAAIAAVFGYWYTQRQTKAGEIAEAHRAHKVEVYSTFMEIIERLMARSREGKPDIDPAKVPREFEDLFARLTRGLLV